MKFAGTIAGFLTLAMVTAWWATLPTTPGAFYAPPEGAPSRPGTLLRHEAYTRGVPAGATARRILYATTDTHGATATSSAIVLVSSTPHEGPRPVIAWMHGTTGAAPGCAPSLFDDPFANVPALQPLLEQGWIFLATDYAGLGTAGQHAYLIGEGEARSALDAIRALRGLPGVEASRDTVVWGHSQGGHAALWTGALAPGYAPDVQILGVAAIAPASDLSALIEAAQHTPVGRILSSYVLRSYSGTYPDVSADAYTRGVPRLLATDMARRCMAGPGALFLVGEAVVARGSLFSSPPTRGPLGARLAENTPRQPISVPLLIAQGMDDPLVLPRVQDRFVRERCEAGQPLEYLRYEGRDHLTVVATDSPLVPALVQWTRDRIRRTPWTSTCPARATDQSGEPPTAWPAPKARPSA